MSHQVRLLLQRGLEASVGPVKNVHHAEGSEEAQSWRPAVAAVPPDPVVAASRAGMVMPTYTFLLLNLRGPVPEYETGQPDGGMFALSLGNGDAQPSFDCTGAVDSSGSSSCEVREAVLISLNSSCVPCANSESNTVPAVPLVVSCAGPAIMISIRLADDLAVLGCDLCVLFERGGCACHSLVHGDSFQHSWVTVGSLTSFCHLTYL